MALSGSSAALPVSLLPAGSCLLSSLPGAWPASSLLLAGSALPCSALLGCTLAGASAGLPASCLLAVAAVPLCDAVPGPLMPATLLAVSAFSLLAEASLTLPSSTTAPASGLELGPARALRWAVAASAVLLALVAFLPASDAAGGDGTGLPTSSLAGSVAGLLLPAFTFALSAVGRVTAAVQVPGSTFRLGPGLIRLAAAAALVAPAGCLTSALVSFPLEAGSSCWSAPRFAASLSHCLHAHAWVKGQ